MKSRLLNKLFEDENFSVDRESVPYVVRDIINMNWWNTCEYMLGYQKNKRVSAKATYDQKLIGILLKEFYRHHQLKLRDPEKLNIELKRYLASETNYLRQLKLFSMPHRRNDSQNFYKGGKATWLDCTSRATYAWKYVAQNGFLDFDGIVRVLGGNDIIKHIKNESVYPYKENALKLFAEGDNSVKAEIFSQRQSQNTVKKWVDKLGIKVIDSRQWLFDEISHVKTDPYKNNEKRLLRDGLLFGVNETLYGYYTSYSIKKCDVSSFSSASCVSHASDASNAGRASCASRASDASYASCASRASEASRTSQASDSSRASDASKASRASRASHASAASDAGVTRTQEIDNWFNVPTAIGPLKGLEHPPVFKKNKYGMAGHWKIDKNVVSLAKKGWFEPFFGHGESALYAAREKIRFTGIELNPDSMNGYILSYIQPLVKDYCTLINGDSSIFRHELIDQFDLCYTSPPYFDFEDYGFHNKIVQECFDYDEYHERVTIPVFKNVYKYLIKSGILALQTEKNKTLRGKWIKAIERVGFKHESSLITGQENNKYSKLSKRDQNLIIFKKD